jgi:predicted enzyme related to lactoylglutathione lyase
VIVAIDLRWIPVEETRDLVTARRGISPDTTLSGGQPQTLSMTKPINWFEIPASDLERASRFYESILGVTLRVGPFGPHTLAVFPYDQETATGGCLANGPGFEPSLNGAIVYLNAGESIDQAITRVEAAGGAVITPKTVLPGDMGAYAHIRDSEGNRVGLHALK